MSESRDLDVPPFIFVLGTVVCEVGWSKWRLLIPYSDDSMKEPNLLEDEEQVANQIDRFVVHDCWFCNESRCSSGS